jgi:Uma2 family endonuclease
MSTHTTLATIADLEAHPGRCELIDGEIIEMSPASPEHGRVTSRVDRVLGAYADKKGGEVLTGEVGFIWDEQTVRAPDVAYLDAKRAKAIPPRGYMSQMPNLVVEVVSPNDNWSDVKRKVRGWLAHGVALVWVVDPETRTVEVHAAGKPLVELSSAQQIDGGTALPGFKAKISAFFGPV